MFGIIFQLKNINGFHSFAISCLVFFISKEFIFKVPFRDKIINFEEFLRYLDNLIFAIELTSVQIFHVANKYYLHLVIDKIISPGFCKLYNMIYSKTNNIFIFKIIFNILSFDIDYEINFLFKVTFFCYFYEKVSCIDKIYLY